MNSLGAVNAAALLSRSPKQRNSYSAVGNADRNGGTATRSRFIGKLFTITPAHAAAKTSRLTGMPTGSTALTSVISKTGLREAAAMNEEQFNAEKLYYISLSAARSMLEKGIIGDA